MSSERSRRRFHIRRSWITLGAVIVLMLIGVLFLTLRGRQQAPETAEVDENLRSEQISAGVLTVTVNATGTLEAEQEANLPFLVSGEVAELLVTPGERVEAQQLLATLDTRLLSLDLRDSELAQKLQEVALAQLQSGPTEEAVAVARATLAVAQARLNQAATGPDEYDKAIADLQIELARNELYREQSQRDLAVVFSSPGGEADWQEDIGMQNILRAELGTDIAEIQREQLLQGPSAGTVATARAQVAAAQASLNGLLDGADEYDLAIAGKQVELAGLSVELAQNSMADAEIRAPYAGTVAEINAEVGEAVQPGAPVIKVVGDDEFSLELDVDEVDIANVQVEQPVEITLDALPGEIIDGRVDSITPVATDVGGVVTYPVRVTLFPTDAPLRAGMTATAVIAVDEVQNAVLVPNWAVRIDRQTGEAFVSVRKPDGAIEEISITIGLRNDMFSEVLDGLETGDEVVVSEEREGLSLFGNEGQ